MSFHSLGRNIKEVLFEVSVSLMQILYDGFQILSLFDNPDDIDKEERLQAQVDSIRQEFGFTTIQKQLLYRRHLESCFEVSLLVDTLAGGLDGLK